MYGLTKNATLEEKNATLEEENATINNQNLGTNSGLNSGLNSGINKEKMKSNLKIKLNERYKTLNETQIDIIVIINENNYITQDEIAIKLNKTQSTIYKSIKKLKDMGIIQRIGAKKSGYWKINI